MNLNLLKKNKIFINLNIKIFILMKLNKIILLNKYIMIIYSSWFKLKNQIFNKLIKVNQFHKKLIYFKDKIKI